MRSTFRRIVASGPGKKIYRGANRVIRKRVHLLVAALVLSLLVASLPVSGRTQGLSSRHTQTASVQWPLYDSVKHTLMTIGGWLTSYVTAKSPRNSYKPVTAYMSPPPFINSPTDLTVTATTSNTIDLSWTAPAGGADHYEVERSNSISGPFLFIGNATGTTYHDTPVTPLHAYLYRVRAVTAGGVPSTPSNMAFGTAIAFEFSSLSGKEIKAQHFHDVRTATNAVRALTANLPQLDWAPRSNLAGLDVKASDVQQIRDALDAALGALSVPVTSYQDSTLTPGTTFIQAVHIEQLQTRSKSGKSTSSGPVDPDSSNARLDPMNNTGGGGENPLSRNFNWNLPLVNLPGRAGMDLSLTLSYNSLVWTKISTSAISFDDDNGFPGPGFRLGFPVIQLPYYNAEVGKEAYLLIGSDGSRTELRKVGTSALYEAGDSSHLLLDTNTMILRTSDGTQMTYEAQGGEYKCKKITDRNGNYITATYDQGRLNTVTDTLGRVISFNYTDGWLMSITQQWLATPAPPHYWARFEYTDKQIDTNFPNMTVYGPQDGNNIKTVTRVKLADESHFDFSYSSWGQVFKVSAYAPNNDLLNYRRYNLPEIATSTDPEVEQALRHNDCPRFTERYYWARYWNGDTEGTPVSGEEALTQFAIPGSASWIMPGANSEISGVRAQVTAPDGISDKIYFLGDYGWQRGLPVLVDTYSSGGSDPVRRSMTTWTQDNTTASYPLNPRVRETNIYDDANNHARKEIVYQEFELANDIKVNLPQVVKEYAADASTILRSRKTIYNMDQDYIDLHIFGLVSAQFLYEGAVDASPLRSKLAFFYDENDSILGNDAPVQHAINFNSSYRFRGNLTSVKRYDVTVTETEVFTTTSSKYDTAGSVVSATDAASHTVAISYADSFSDGGNSRNTLAYPTASTDPDNNSSTLQYNFNFGAITRRQTPKPNVEDDTPEETWTYDSIGRLQQITNLVNDGYTRFEYATSQSRVDSYTTIQDGLGEAHSFEISDGAGRIIATATDHNLSTNTFSGQRMIYDVMGRVIKTSNPTETSASGAPFQWNTTGDDQGTGWIYTEQTYDWKGRPLVTTNPSMTGNAADTTSKQISYSGCGCAGGEVITLTDEGTIFVGVLKKRQRKLYSDVLGRIVKTEILNWDGAGPNGTGGTVYSTTVNAYDARDLVTTSTQYAGPEGSATSQVTTMTYDGYGRLSTRHVPEQAVGKVTTWTYNSDDNIYTLTDARGAETSYTYNARHLPDSITHALSGSSTIGKSFTYDSAGNRKSMSHTINGVQQDRASYTYDANSRLISETKHINALAGNSMGGDYTINYSYTISGQLQSITDPFGSPTTYTYNKVGRNISVVGTYGGVNRNYVSSVDYRAWGGIKSIAFNGGSPYTISYNARLLPTQFRGCPGAFDYGYHEDGKLKSILDLADQTGNPRDVQFHYMSRQYSYDHANRMTGVGQFHPTVIPPFSGSYGYDAFGHMTSRSGNYALNTPVSDSATFSNNRRTGWTYDDDGRVKISPDPTTGASRSWNYDAAGQQIFVSETVNGANSSDTLGYDGDDNILRDSVNTNGGASIVTSYLIHSSVLAKVLVKLNASGSLDTTYVPLNQLATALLQKDFQGNPTLGWVAREASGLQENDRAIDPFGNKIFNVQPPVAGGPPNIPFYGPGYTNPNTASFSNGNNFAISCVLDGVSAPCDQVMRAVNNRTIDPNSLRLSTTGGLADFANAGLGGLVLDLNNPQKVWKPDQVAQSGPPKLFPPGAVRPRTPITDDPNKGEAPGHWETYYEISAFIQAVFPLTQPPVVPDGLTLNTCLEDSTGPLASLRREATFTFMPTSAQTPGSPPIRPFFSPDFATRLSNAIIEMNQIGIVPQINDAFRTEADQQWYRTNGANGNPVAQSTSDHQTGNAVDINGLTTTMRTILKKYGLSPISNDPPHFKITVDNKAGVAKRAEEYYWKHCANLMSDPGPTIAF